MDAIDELVSRLGDDDPVRASRARRALARAVDMAPRPGGLADALAAELIAEADPRADAEADPDRAPDTPGREHPAAVRNLLCRLLGQCATDEQVPALRRALEDLETREMARCALGCIASIAATDALIGALSHADPGFRIGVINELGRRRWRQAMVALRRQSSDPDAEVRLAALEALANIPAAANDDLMREATRTGPRRDRRRARKARLRFAETLLRAGDRRSAATIYRDLAADDEDDAPKAAARLALDRLEASPTADRP